MRTLALALPLVCLSGWLGLPGSARAELRLPSEHTWAVETRLPEGALIEYLLCDPDGECESWGLGDATRAGSPVEVNHVGEGVMTLRARYCSAAEDVSEVSCGPLSEPSAPFRYDPSLPPEQLVSIDAFAGFGSLLLRAGESYESRLPLGIAPPIVSSVLQVELGIPDGGALVLLDLRSGSDPNYSYLSEELELTDVRETITRRIQNLSDAVSWGETELELVLTVLDGSVTLGLGDPFAVLTLPSDHHWAVSTEPGPDEVVEYLLCETFNDCDVWGVGDGSKPGAPVRVRYVGPGIKTLRARFCERTADGDSTGNCGPLSDPSAPFQFSGSFPNLASGLADFLARLGRVEDRFIERIDERLLGDRLEEAALHAPHITSAPLFGTIVSLFDADRDGVPLWSAPGLAACESGNWLGCFDNCGERHNPGQANVCN